jgi:hypothetical protein
MLEQQRRVKHRRHTSRIDDIRCNILWGYLRWNGDLGYNVLHLRRVLGCANRANRQYTDMRNKRFFDQRRYNCALPHTLCKPEHMSGCCDFGNDALTISDQKDAHIPSHCFKVSVV